MRWPWSGGAADEETLIGSGTEFRGDVTVKGSIHIAGAVVGDVRCEHRLVVGEDGRVEGDLAGRVVIVAGRVRGRVEAVERIELLPSACVTGDLEAPRLAIAEGATFEGSSAMPAAPQPAPARAPGRRGERPSPGASGGAS